jgi:hypothetical protein
VSPEDLIAVLIDQDSVVRRCPRTDGNPRRRLSGLRRRPDYWRLARRFPFQ